MENFYPYRVTTKESTVLDADLSKTASAIYLQLNNVKSYGKILQDPLCSVSYKWVKIYEPKGIRKNKKAFARFKNILEKNKLVRTYNKDGSVTMYEWCYYKTKNYWACGPRAGNPGYGRTHTQVTFGK